MMQSAFDFGESPSKMDEAAIKTVYQKKFMGKTSFNFTAAKNRMLKVQSENKFRTKASLIGNNLNPKVIEIEKLAKTQHKRKSKANNIIDGVTDLQLYMAKKVVKNQYIPSFSVRNILQHKHKIVNEVFPQRKMSMLSNAEHEKQFERMRLNKMMEEQAKDELHKSYNSKQQSSTDKQFIEKFNKFIVIKKEENRQGLDFFGPDKLEKAQSTKIDEIKHKKQKLNRIVEKMIVDRDRRQNEFIDQDEQVPQANKKYSIYKQIYQMKLEGNLRNDEHSRLLNIVKSKVEEFKKKQKEKQKKLFEEDLQYNGSINKMMMSTHNPQKKWTINNVLKECDQFQKQFKIRKAKSTKK